MEFVLNSVRYVGVWEGIRREWIEKFVYGYFIVSYIELVEKFIFLNFLK